MAIQTRNQPNVVEAVLYLKRRYAEHSLKYPVWANRCPEAQYVAVNLPYTLRNQRMGYGHWETPHASDCAYWVKEECNCTVGKEAKQ